MGEILFRGKRIDNGEWIHGFLVIYGDDYYIAPDINAYTSIGGGGKGRCMMFGHYYQVHSETVGQFTGLTDKNGRKIFEGNIIHLEYSQVFFGGEYFGEYTAEVSYKEGCFITDGINNGDEIETPLSGFDNDEVEIIGNIHDNPELLGGESDG